MRLKLKNVLDSINVATMMIIVATVIVLSLSACSSAPNSTSYYLLNNQVSASPIYQEGLTNSSVINNRNKATALLSVHLADYLNSPYLVMQINQHKIEYATFHMWAEPLTDSSFNALLSDLNSLSTRFKFIPEPQLRGTKANQQAALSVNIDYFHVTAQSKVILSGHYEYLNQQETGLDADQSRSQAFSFEAPLQQDGYSDSVAQMRELVNKLAKQITTHIDR